MITSERVNIGWWNLGGSCIVQKSPLSSNLGSQSPGVHPQKCGIRLRPYKISAGCLVLLYIMTVSLTGAMAYQLIVTFGLLTSHLFCKKNPTLSLSSQRAEEMWTPVLCAFVFHSLLFLARLPLIKGRPPANVCKLVILLWPFWLLWPWPWPDDLDMLSWREIFWRHTCI